MGETWSKLAKHYRWAREQGVRRLIEEDQLNPVDRARSAYTKAAWRHRNPVAPGSAVGVFVVGLQRSGTNMLLRGLEQAGEVEVHNENDRRAFHRFQLRADPTVRAIVGASRHRLVLFKPLCDSHRTLELLDLCGPGSGRAIWAYRRVDDRVRSSVAKFGASNLSALTAIAEGRGAGMWQSGGLTEPDRELLRSLDVARMDPASGSALFWYLRNKLFFELGLDTHQGVRLASYEGFLADPQACMQGLCSWLGVPFRPDFVAGIEPARSANRPALQLEPKVRALCEEIQARLEAARLEPARAQLEGQS